MADIVFADKERIILIRFQMVLLQNEIESGADGLRGHPRVRRSQFARRDAQGKMLGFVTTARDLNVARIQSLITVPLRRSSNV